MATFEKYFSGDGGVVDIYQPHCGLMYPLPPFKATFPAFIIPPPEGIEIEPPDNPEGRHCDEWYGRLLDPFLDFRIADFIGFLIDF